MAGLGLWSVATGDLRAVLAELESLVRVAQAAQVAVLGEVAARGEALVPGGLTPGERAVLARSRAGDGRGELAGVLGVHPATAARRQATVAYVTGSGLPAQRVARTGGRGAGLGEGTATAAALAQGLVSVEAADVVAATVLDLPEHYGPVGRAAVERVLLAHAPEVPLTVLRHHAAGLLARAELSEAGEDVLASGEAALEGTDLLGRREERAHRRRELYCSPDLTGTWHVRGRLAPEAGATLMTALEALAAPEPSGEQGPDLRSAAQRRADALVALADKALSAPPASETGLPSEGGARARVVVTMDLPALTGAVRGAGLLADDAPLSAGAVRRLACDAEVVPAVLGSRSEPLDVGRAAYTVTPAQRRALALRDRGCIAPDCSAPVSRTHAHHVVHWADGGPTDLSNLALVAATTTAASTPAPSSPTSSTDAPSSPAPATHHQPPPHHRGGHAWTTSPTSSTTPMARTTPAAPTTRLLPSPRPMASSALPSSPIVPSSRRAWPTLLALSPHHLPTATRRRRSGPALAAPPGRSGAAVRLPTRRGTGRHRRTPSRSHALVGLPRPGRARARLPRRGGGLTLLLRLRGAGEPELSRGSRACRGSDRADALGLGALLALPDLELDLLALVEGAVALHVDLAVVHEDVSAAVARRDEAEALLRVEPLHGSLCHVTTTPSRVSVAHSARPADPGDGASAPPFGTSCAPPPRYRERG